MEILTLLDENLENDLVNFGVRFLDRPVHYNTGASTPRLGELERLQKIEEDGGLVALKTGQDYSVYQFEPLDPEDEGTQAILNKRNKIQKLRHAITGFSYNYQIRETKLPGEYTDYDELLDAAESAVAQGEVVGVVNTSREEVGEEDLIPDNYVPTIYQ
ncbi:MAG: hypothetical protein ABEK16_04695 [Candidatus Nanohalobium sp.]